MDQINEALYEGMETADQLMRKSIKLYSEERCFGWRECLGQEEEVQPDGKVFKKVWQSPRSYHFARFQFPDQKPHRSRKLGFKFSQSSRDLVDEEIEEILV